MTGKYIIETNEWCVLQNKCPTSIHFQHLLICWNLCQLPVQGNCHQKTNNHSLKQSIYDVQFTSHACFWDVKLENPERTHIDKGKTCKLEKSTGIKPTNFLLWDHSANYCTTALPSGQRTQSKQPCEPFLAPKPTRSELMRFIDPWCSTKYVMTRKSRQQQAHTSAEFPSEANTGVVVALAVLSVDASEGWCVTHTLSAVALALAAAHLRLVAGEAVAQQGIFLIALALGAHESRLTHAHAALEIPLTLRAQVIIGLGTLSAVTRAKRLQLHLQRVLQTDWSEGEVPRPGQTPWEGYSHVEHNLRSREDVSLVDLHPNIDSDTGRKWRHQDTNKCLSLFIDDTNL